MPRQTKRGAGCAGLSTDNADLAGPNDADKDAT